MRSTGGEETKCLIEIWPDDLLKSPLERNSQRFDTFQLFSKRTGDQDAAAAAAAEAVPKNATGSNAIIVLLNGQLH